MLDLSICLSIYLDSRYLVYVHIIYIYADASLHGRHMGFQLDPSLSSSGQEAYEHESLLASVLNSGSILLETGCMILVATPVPISSAF